MFSALSRWDSRQVATDSVQVGGSCVTTPAQPLPISRQAVTKHLKELEGAGLLFSEKEGRQTRYSAARHGLDNAALWLANRSNAWDERLDGCGILRKTEKGDRHESAVHIPIWTGPAQ